MDVLRSLSVRLLQQLSFMSFSSFFNDCILALSKFDDLRKTGCAKLDAFFMCAIWSKNESVGL